MCMRPAWSMVADLSIRVPEDLAVIAYDDSAALALVPLTAVTAPGRDLGQQARRILIDRIAKAGAERSAPRHLMMRSGLTVRSSCGPRMYAVLRRTGQNLSLK